MSENKECLFYIDHNPPEYSGTWGGAIHKGACKINSTDCKDTDECFIKNLYNKQKECEKINQALDEIEKLIPKFDTSDGCSYGDYDCENCSDLDEDIVCTYKLKKVIKGIINKTKDGE